MAEIGTPLSSSATKVLFCGAGELGKEVIIEMMRLGVEVIAVDRYANAPGMQVAHRSYVINMLDGKELRAVIGGRDAPTAAGEYDDPELFFQLLQGTGQGWLRHI